MNKPFDTTIGIILGLKADGYTKEAIINEFANDFGVEEAKRLVNKAWNLYN